MTTKAPNHPVVPGAARWSQSPVEAATLRHRAHWSQRYHHHNRRRTHLYTLQSTSTPLVHFPFDDQPTCTPPIRRTTSQAVGRQTAGGAEAWPAHTARSPALGTRVRYAPVAVSSRAYRPFRPPELRSEARDNLDGMSHRPARPSPDDRLASVLFCSAPLRHTKAYSRVSGQAAREETGRRKTTKRKEEREE